MQSTRESSRQKRNIKRRNSRKKSLSPSDLKCVDAKTENKLGRRTLSEGSMKVKHRKSNVQRTLTHPISSDFVVPVDNVFCAIKEPVPPESDESHVPPTSSDRDTEDDARAPKPPVARPRWDSGSEMDSLVSIAVRKASARRRRTSANPDWGVNSEPGEVSEPEAGRMRPEDYRLVFLSSDSSCREDTEDSASTASSAAPPAPDDCDWDYFEPGAAAAPPPPPQPPKHTPQDCQKACSCGAEPRFVAVPVPVPVPVPAALWPALLAFAPQTPPTPHWNTYPGFPPLDAAAIARITTAAAVAVTAAATANSLPRNRLEMTVERTDKAIQSELQTLEPRDNDKSDNSIEHSVQHETSDDIKVIAEDVDTETMPDHLDAEKAFPSSNESAESSDSEKGVARRSYDLRSAAPEEPPTSDEDSDDSGGGGGQFSRVFVVNPASSSSENEDNADSSGIDCDDSDDKKSDSLEIVAREVALQNDIHDYQEDACSNNNVVVLQSVNFTEEYSLFPFQNQRNSESENIANFRDKSMLMSETNEEYNSFNDAYCSDRDLSNYDSLNQNVQSASSSDVIECDSLDNSCNFDCNIKVSVDLPTDTCNTERISNPAPNVLITKPAPSPEPKYEDSNNSSSPPIQKIDLFKGIERTLSELLKKELMEDRGEEKMHISRPVCVETEGARAHL
ncbi:unnamed protein product [Leptosia nina]|uniref:Uncharacterized protein n=1 Tax=Leptosia nina TaxID=320188 RepID=A0AAV1J9J9_9NEOP